GRPGSLVRPHVAPSCSSLYSALPTVHGGAQWDTTRSVRVHGPREAGGERLRVAGDSRSECSMYPARTESRRRLPHIPGGGGKPPTAASKARAVRRHVASS